MSDNSQVLDDQQEDGEGKKGILFLKGVYFGQIDPLCQTTIFRKLDAYLSHPRTNGFAACRSKHKLLTHFVCKINLRETAWKYASGTEYEKHFCMLLKLLLLHLWLVEEKVFFLLFN